MEVTSPCEDVSSEHLHVFLTCWDTLFENWSMQSMVSKQRSTKHKSTQFLIIAFL